MGLPWWKRDPNRYLAELEAANHMPGFHRISTAERVVLCGPVDVDGTVHTVRVEYTDEFPLTAPRVFEIHPQTGERLPWPLPYHIYPNDQALCLYTLGQGDRGWRPEYTLADILERYSELRRTANAALALNEADSTPLAPIPQNNPLLKVVLPKDLWEFCAKGGEWGLLQCHTVFAEQSRIVVTLVRAKTKNKRAVIRPTDAAALIPPAAALLPPAEGLWLRVPKGWARGPLLTHEKRHSVLRKLPAQQRELIKGGAPALLIDGEAPEQCAGWLAHEGTPQGHAVLQVDVMDPIERIFCRVDGKLSGRKALQSLTVVMVGLGSLGSHVALHLAKAGVSKFDLFDPDVLELENVTRHIGNLQQIGHSKTRIVGAAILGVNPSAQVTATRGSVPFDSVNAGAITEFRTVYAQPGTLMVVTTAIDSVERSINRLAVEAKAPVVFGSVIGAGEVGRIFRVIPGKTPCYECILAAQEHHPEKFPRFGDHDAAGVPAPYRQGGIPALGMDVEIIANFTARMALQTLGRMTDDLGIADAGADHLLWSNNNTEHFDHPLQLRTESYPMNPDCPICGQRAETSTDSVAASRARISDLELQLTRP